MKHVTKDMQIGYKEPGTYGWDEDGWNWYGRAGGVYPSFWKTVSTSKEWREWEKYAFDAGFDWAESSETGWLSPEHFKAFIEFIKNNNHNYMNEKTRPICKKCADKLNLEPIIGDLLLCEPCADCGALTPTQFTDFMKAKKH